MGSWGCPYLRRFPFSCAHRTPTASSLFLNCFALRPAGCGVERRLLLLFRRRGCGVQHGSDCCAKIVRVSQAFCQPLKKSGILHRRQPAGARCCALWTSYISGERPAVSKPTDFGSVSVEQQQPAIHDPWRGEQPAIHDPARGAIYKMAGLVGGDGKLIAIIGDEDTVTGFVLAGVGHRTAESSNFLVVKEGTPLPQIEKAFLEFTNRDDVGIVLVNQHVAAQIRHLLDDYSKTIPTVLEMPSKDMPYDPAQDYIMQRVSAMLNTGDGGVGRIWFCSRGAPRNIILRARNFMRHQERHRWPGLSPGLEAGARISTVFAHLRNAPVGPDLTRGDRGGTQQHRARRGAKVAPGAPLRRRRRGVTGVSLRSPLLPLNYHIFAFLA